MNFNFTEEQDMVRETLSRFMREKYDFETRNNIIASQKGYSPEIWQELADLGLMGAAFDEEYDGFGGTMADIMVLMEEFGKGLLIEPFLPTVVLCGQMLRSLGGDAAKELIPQIISGELIMSLGFAEPKSRFCLSHVETTAKQDGDDYVLNGQKAVALGAPIAQKLIVSARISGATRDENGIGLFLVDADAAGVHVDGYATIDGFQAGEIMLNDAKAVCLSTDGFAVLENIIDKAIIAITAESIGVCQSMLALTREYTSTRMQFDVPLSSFQVLQHKMVDMLIHSEEVTSMAFMGAIHAESTEFDTRKAASAAKIQLGKSCKFVGEAAIQLHGGMGITEEMAVGHYFMHSTMLELLFGNTEFHQRRYEALSA